MTEKRTTKLLYLNDMTRFDFDSIFRTDITNLITEVINSFSKGPVKGRKSSGDFALFCLFSSNLAWRFSGASAALTGFFW